MMHLLKRADVMLYGDLTVRNKLNELYDIAHIDDAQTKLLGAADFADTRLNRDLIDRCAAENGWYPYRSVGGFLMYHLQEDDLALV